MLRWICGLMALVFATGVAAQESALRVATIERPPFVMLEDDALSGFSIDLMREVADRLDREVEFEIAESFPDMLKQVQDQGVDLAIANISITASREETMDFSLPIYDSGMRILVREGNEAGFLSLLWQSGVPQLVLAAILILVAVAHLMWFLEGRKHDAHPYFRGDYPAGVWDAFWWAFIIVTMGGFENERPRRIWAQVFAVFWVVVGLFFISSFTAMITTAMTVEQLQTGIRDYRDLKGKKVGIAVGTSFEEFARTNGLGYRPYADFSKAVAAVEAGDIDATFGDAPVVDYYALNGGAGKVVATGDVFAPEKIGAAFPEGSDLREPFNRALLRIVEDGTYERLQTRYFNGN